MKLTRLSPLLLATCCLLLAAPIARAADVVAHWSFDQLTDDAKSFPDATGNRNAAISDKSSATLDNGKDVQFGKAVALGPGGNGLSIPPLPNIYEHSFTVATWVKLADSGHNYLLADWPKPNHAYAFGFDNGKVICMLRNEKLDKKGNTTDIINGKTLNVPISAGAWHHVAWVWDRTGPKAGTLSVYLDGAKAGEAAATGKVPANIVNNARPASIGYKADTNGAFHGSVDELWVFNDALSADQINNLMKSNDINNAGALAIVTPSPSPTPTPAAPAQITTPTPAQPTPAQPAPQATADNTPPTFVIPNNPAPTPTPATPAPTTPTQTTTPAPSFIVTPTTPTITTPTIINPVATITPPHYTPARIAGIIVSGITALLLSGFLFWASQERGKMRQSHH